MIPVLIILFPVLVLTSSFDSKTTKDFNKFKLKTENNAKISSNSNMSIITSAPIPIIKTLSEKSINRVAFSPYSGSANMNECYIFSPRSRNKSDIYRKSPISEPDFQKILDERIYPKSKSEGEVNAQFSDEDVEEEEDNTAEKIDKEELVICVEEEDDNIFNMDA